MSKVHLITAAQACARPNDRLLESMESYAEQRSGNLTILPMIGQHAREDWDQLHPDIAVKSVEYDTRKLNDAVQIEQFHVRPYQVDPVTGLKRFAQRERTQVFASPKQRMMPIAHSTRKHPKFLVTTGAVTLPNYATSEDTSAERRRLGSIAKRDHVLGGLVVEIVGKKQFFMRHISANNKGNFIDLGTKYDGKDIKEGIRPDAMVLGDWHSGRTDPKVLEVTIDMIDELKPKRVVLHDFFDGHSVSHHVDKQPITQGLLQQEDLGHSSLEQELQQGYEELCMLSELTDEVVVVMSNHHEFLWRWLNEGRFMSDKENMRFGFKLADHMAAQDENDPVEFGYRMMGDLPKNIRFLRRTDDFKVRGYQLGAHGDKGPGLGYGSINSKENDWGASISGHVHKAQIQRRTHTVGTMLPLDMYYTRGQPSDWSNSHAVVYPNGSVQHLILNRGRYRLDDAN
jgi:hypothetical protein